MGREFVVLCGPTYLTRLWCIIELFTFVHIGRGEEFITILHLARETKQGEDNKTINIHVEEFDVEQCKCHYSTDKEKMLKVIMTAFGDMSSFNVAVRKLMTATIKVNA